MLTLTIRLIANGRQTTTRQHIVKASTIVVCGIVTVRFAAEIQSRLAHNLARSDEFAKTFLVSKRITGGKRTSTPPGRWCTHKVLRFVRSIRYWQGKRNKCNGNSINEIVENPKLYRMAESFCLRRTRSDSVG